ncbi:MAG: hypothetical protein JST73_05040 [Actinobacteria bacterium]|nr:hypothetical protein [Actinomycetota bacterium]
MTRVPDPLDEFPLHQTPLSMAYVATSDRNFYDRCYFNAHDGTGDVYVITGAGVYPNLGVVDAFALVRRGSHQWALRCSDALESTDRRAPTVGPYRIEVIEPLEVIRVVCDGDEHGIGFDLTWTGSFPAEMEQPHVMRTGARAIIDASRFAQVGTWSGEVRIDGEKIEVTADRWIGSRDRSWGIRPSGDAEPPGRAADEPLEGFWWTYVPLRFEDHALVVIIQETADGFRTLNNATRTWADGRREQLGWPEVEIDYASGTRHPTAARLRLFPRGGDPFTLEIDTVTSIALHVGGGYGGDPEWAHGRWMGRGWVDGSVYDLDDPEIVARTPFGVIDHVARARYVEGGVTHVGAGMFEHGTFGRHDPSGFADWSSLAD